MSNENCSSCKILNKIYGDERNCDDHVIKIGHSVVTLLIESFQKANAEAEKAMEEGKITELEYLELGHLYMRTMAATAAAIPASLPGYLNGIYSPEQMLHLVLETFNKGGMKIMSVPISMNPTAEEQKEAN